MKKGKGLIVALCACGLLLACQSTKGSNASGTEKEAWSIAPGKSIIQTEVMGFSPTSATGKTTIEFALYFANADAIKKWKMSIIDFDGNVSKKVSGNGTYLPALIEWNGKDSSGGYSPEGTYVARLDVNYGDAFAESIAISTSFVLDITPPSGKISFFPSLFSPMSDTDRMKITVTPDKGIAKIDSWSLEIYDPAWNLFAAFTEKWPTDSISWNGHGFNGDLVVSAEDYPVVVRLRDEFGNVGLIDATLPVDVIVIKDGDNYRIENSRIYFKDFTANYENVPVSLSRQNILRLDRLAEQLKKYPDHNIVIVGHAVMMNWNDKDLGKIEQDEVLIPLSKARAEAIKKAMVTRGINPAKIKTEGVGAASQLVPDNDFANRWRNRRTAIFLVK